MSDNLINVMKAVPQDHLLEATDFLQGLRDEYETSLYTGRIGNLIEITVNFRSVMQSVNLSDSLMTDKKLLQDLIPSAYNKACMEVRKAADEYYRKAVKYLTQFLSTPTSVEEMTEKNKDSEDLH